MRVSASQFDTYDLCPRKWFGQKVLKLPELPRGHFAYGEVQHEVAERFLGSTLSGRVPEDPLGALEGQVPGTPTNLFPEGWQKDLSYGEAQHIADTTKLAIEEGVLVRKPDSVVELWFELPFVDDIQVVGAIDYSYPWVIEDHKTTKSVKYAATDKTIISKLPMKLYAWAYAELLGSPPDHIGVRHNIFRKDIVDVHVAENTIPTEEIYSFVDGLRVVAKEMLELKETTTSFLKAPGPTSARACQAFGGCPLQKICGKQLTVGQYEKQISNLTSKTIEGPKGIFGALPKEAMGSLEERLAKFAAKKAGSSEKPIPEVKEVPAPPWVYDKCTACDGIGWNSKGNPCKICQNMTEVPAYKMVLIKLDDKRIQWTSDTDTGVCRGPHGGLPAATEAEPEPIATPEPEPREEATEEAYEEEIPPTVEPEPKSTVPPPVKVLDIDLGKKTRGRPKKSFTLALNCLPVRGSAKVQHLDVLFKSLMEQYKKDKGVPYYTANAFERRDMFAAVAEKIAEDLGTDILFACPDSPDTRALVDALRPYATMVWAPMGQTVTVVRECAFG